MKKIILFFTLFIIFSAIITFAQDIQQGNGTWYEDDSMELNASHARFPPGTRLRVTNLNNQKEVYVTVTDRIQNSDNRILDLSQEAASLLGMNRRGYTPIRLVVIRGLIAESTPSDPNTDSEDEPDPEYNIPEYTIPEYNTVPEMAAVSSPDYENNESYSDYSDYSDYADFADYAENSFEAPPTTAASVETPQYTPPPPSVRTYPNQYAPQSQPAHQSKPAPAAQSQAESKVLLKKLVVIINGKEQTIDIPDGVYIPLPANEAAPSTPVYTYPPPSTPAYSLTPPPPSTTTRVIIPAPPTPPPRQITVTPPPPAPSAPSAPPPRQMPVPPPVQVINPVIKIIPKLPDPNSGKVYRIQVAAFSHIALAQVCFDRLKAAGLSPAYEQNGSIFRVVLSGIKAGDVSNIAQRLSAAGFTEAWIREESRH